MDLDHKFGKIHSELIAEKLGRIATCWSLARPGSLPTFPRLGAPHRHRHRFRHRKAAVTPKVHPDKENG